MYKNSNSIMRLFYFYQNTYLYYNKKYNVPSFYTKKYVNQDAKYFLLQNEANYNKMIQNLKYLPVIIG